VTSGERSRLYPQTPTMRESGIKNFEALQWHGVWAPAATPAPVVERLNTELNSIITFPPVVERMRAEGADPMSGTPRAFAQFIASEMAKWAEVIRVSGARLE